MKEHPILFSTPMVQAILAGRKTQTRRLMKPQPILHNDVIKIPIGLEEYSKELKAWKKKGYTHIGDKEPLAGYLFRPIKKEIGDQLWVRETWAQWEYPEKRPFQFAYKADGFEQRYGAWEKDTPKKLHDIERIETWRPSLFMPREASRIQLEIENIRAERLGDITTEDAIAEGVELLPDEMFSPAYTGGKYKVYHSNVQVGYHARESFLSLWESINPVTNWKEEGQKWVWAFTFKKIDHV